MDTKELDSMPGLCKAIDAWGKRGKQWVKDGQTLAMKCLALHETSGDTGPINRLYLAMPKGTKSGAMAEWLLTYGGVKANEGGDKKSKPFLHDKSKATNLIGGAQTPWYTFQPEKEPDQVFDVIAAVKKILEKAASGKQTLLGESALEGLRAIVEDAEGAPLDDDENPNAPAGNPDVLALVGEAPI